MMTNPLPQIHEGMDIRDRNGNHIGSVDWVKMTDENPDTAAAEQVTPEATRQSSYTIVDGIADAFRTDEVPAQLRDELLRKGFVRMDADGIFASDRYVLPEQISRVADGDVFLNVSKDELIKRV